MSETEQRIKFMEQFEDYKTKERRERIQRAVKSAVEDLRRGRSDQYDMLCWGASVTLPANSTEDQRASQRELIDALKEARKWTTTD